MYIVTVTYLTPLDEVDAHLPAHVEFLEANFASGMFLAAGRQVPRTGGVILARAGSRRELDRVLELDPFKQHGVARYQVLEFTPNLVAPGLESLREELRS